MSGETSVDTAALRDRLFAYRIGPEDAAFSFSERLSRENRWTADFASRVIREYLRFCYLAVTQGRDVTPSDAVDQVWHLHLTYSRDYWQRFCPEVLGMELHHGPTAGGQVERARYYEQYAQTLALYEDAFGEPPPPDIWSSAARRFGVDPFAFRVNPKDTFVFPRTFLLPFAVAALLVIGLAVFLGAYFA